MEQLVLEELHRIRKEGFTQSAIDAAINTTEFSLRENNTGRFPRGLSMMLRAMNAWVYDRDPYKCAALSSTWARIPLAGHPTPVMHAIHALTAPPPPAAMAVAPIVLVVRNQHNWWYSLNRGPHGRMMSACSPPLLHGAPGF